MAWWFSQMPSLKTEVSVRTLPVKTPNDFCWLLAWERITHVVSVCIFEFLHFLPGFLTTQLLSRSRSSLEGCVQLDFCRDGSLNFQVEPNSSSDREMNGCSWMFPKQEGCRSGSEGFTPVCTWSEGNQLSLVCICAFLVWMLRSSAACDWLLLHCLFFYLFVGLL